MKKEEKTKSTAEKIEVFMARAEQQGGNGLPSHVLVADDEPYIQQMLKHSLEACGFTVSLAADGEKAVELWRGADFDLILMDLRMPVLGGCAAALQIRREETDLGRKSTPIIALTAVYHEVIPETFEACGMNDILPKPIAGDPLCDSVTRNLAG